MAQEAFKVGIQGEQPLEDTVVKVFRSAKVVKGGRRFSFASLVVVGDRNGTVGIGYGKANEVPPAVEKAIKDAKKNLHNIALVDGTLPYKINGSTSAKNVVKAVMNGLLKLRDKEAVESLRGVKIEAVKRW